MLSCNLCCETKDCSEFSPRKSRKRGYSYSCKKCIAEKARNRKFPPKTNGNKRCTKCKEIKDYGDFFACRKMKDGRDTRCKSCQNDRKMYRLSTQPSLKIVENLRRRTRAALAGTNKSESTLALIGCSPEELREHLESKFEDGMNWGNYGEWHIDHIRPCASFDLTIATNQKECFNYMNLQPLWAEENLKKGDSYEKL